MSCRAPRPDPPGNMGDGTLTAKEFPKRTRIQMHCSGRGCPFRKVERRVKSRRKAVKLRRLFGNRALRRGVRVELRFTVANHIGRVLRFRMGSPGSPDVDFLCKPSGGKIPDC